MNKLYQHTTLQLLLDAWSNDRNQKIGTDSMLRIQQLVNQLPEDCEAASFRNMLAALLVKSPEEQKEFYALFEQCLKEANKLIGGKVEGKNEKLTTPEENEAKKKFQYSIAYFIIALVLLFGIIYGLMPKPVIEGKGTSRVIRASLNIGDTLPSIDIRAAEITAPIESINPSGTQKTNRNHTVLVDDSGFVTFIANGDRTANVRDTFDAYLNYAHQIDTVHLIVTLTEKAQGVVDPPVVDELFLDPIPLLKPNGIDSLIISKEEIAAGEWWDKWKWPIVVGVIILLGMLLWGIWRWIQYLRAKVVADLQNTDKAPYIWHPETGAINQEWLEEVSRPLLNRFRSRTPDDALLLDIPATIKVTSQQAGRLSLQYTNRTLPPNYLLLIDRYSAQDHQARLFDALYQHLKKKEIPVFRYYFNGDPRICTNEAFPNGITLVELMQKHAAAKLLIVGEGMGLLSQRSGRLAPWTTILEKWKNKVLLSPKVRNEWGTFEKVLEDLFLVLPASMQGLSMAVESFLSVDTPMQAELWPKVKDSILSPIALDGPLIVSLHEQFEKTPAMVDWIAACAVWPKLSWDLTLHLGAIIDKKLIRFDHLREMNRLPWFIQGHMPRAVRELLLDYLNAQGLEEKVRTAIQQLFKELKNKPQKGSVADDYYQMNIILNELFLNPDKEKKKQLEKQFADYLAAGNDPDFVALRLLDRKPNRIDQLLGNRFKKYVYKQGLPKLGVQKWIWLATTWAVLSLGIGIGACFSGETALCTGLKVAYKEHTLCLENERDSLLYYQQLAKDAIEAQNHEQVDSIKALADVIQPQDSIFYLNTAYNYHNYGVNAYNCGVEEDPTCDFQAPKDSLHSLACYNFEKGIAFLSREDGSTWKVHPFQSEALSNCQGTAVTEAVTPIDTTIEIKGYIVDRITNTTVANAKLRLGYASDVSFEDMEDGTSDDFFETKSRSSGNFYFRGLPQKGESLQLRITNDLYDALEVKIPTAQQNQVNRFQLQPNEEAFSEKARTSELAEDYQAYLDRFPNGSWAEDFQLAVTPSPTPTVTPSQLPIPPTELIPAGNFTMGCLSEERDGDCYDREKPARIDVKVNAFYMGKYEVTVEEYLAFADATNGNYPEWLEEGSSYHIETGTNSYYKDKGYSREGNKLPIVGISWNNAVAYCQWLSQQTGQNYRLPSEAEWEYAARGAEQGAKDKFLYSGSSTIDEVAWYDGNSGNQTHEVGKQQPNQLGLYDMSGNVWEWCADPWHDTYDNAPKDARVWEEGVNNSYRVLRGGSWDFNSRSCRVANRSRNNPGNRYIDYGFRVARDL